MPSWLQEEISSKTFAQLAVRRNIVGNPPPPAHRILKMLTRKRCDIVKILGLLLEKGRGYILPSWLKEEILLKTHPLLLSMVLLLARRDNVKP